jgi:hydroxypyruvate isomerase
MLGLNTPKSAGGIGQFGLCALPGQEALARSVIDKSLDFSNEIGARCLHVMAGIASGPAAQESFCAALTYACHQAKQSGVTILIEPLNRYDAPGYFLMSDVPRAMFSPNCGRDCPSSVISNLPPSPTGKAPIKAL